MTKNDTERDDKDILSDCNMTPEQKADIESKIVDVLRTVFDPEIPVNIYDLD